MGTPPAIATRREVRSDELDLAALGLWLCRTIECAGRIPQNHLRALCDAVLAMVQSYVAESGGADRVAVEVERDGGCVALAGARLPGRERRPQRRAGLVGLSARAGSLAPRRLWPLSAGLHLGARTGLWAGAPS